MPTEDLDELRESIKGIDKQLLMTAEQARLLKLELGGLNKFIDSKNYEILSRFISGTGAWRVMNKIKATIQTLTQLQSITERGDLEEAKRTKKLGELIRAKNKSEEVHAKVMAAANSNNIDALKEMAEESDSLTVALEKFNVQGTSALIEYAERIKKAQDQTQDMVDMVTAAGQPRVSYKEKVSNMASLHSRGLKFAGLGVRDGGIGEQKLGKHALKIHRRVLQLELKNLQDKIGKKTVDMMEKSKNFLKNISKIVGKFLLYGLLIVIGITLLVAVVKSIWPSIQRSQETFMNVFGSMIDMLDTILGFIGSSLMMIYEGVTSGRLELVILGVLGVLGGVIALAFGSLLTVILWLGTYILTGIQSYFSSMTGIVQGIKKMIGTILTGIMIIASGVALVALLFASFPIAIGAAIIAGVAAVAKAIIPFSSGGVVNSNMQLVGEKGAELVSLPRGSRVHSNADSRRMLASSGGNTINVHVNGRVGASDAEIRDIANKVAREINLRMSRTGSGVNNF